jgi:ATP-binding cassette, subfamily B, bacterial PglK
VVRRAINFIPQEFKTQGLSLIVLLVLASVLDLFSLASFFPLILVIIHPEKLEGNFHSELYSDLGFSDMASLAAALTLGALVFLVIKTFFSTWVTRKKADFAYSVAQRLAERMLDNYLRTPFKVYSSVDYAREVNRISNAPLTFANNFIIPIGTIVGETIVAGSLVIAAAVYEPRTFFFLIAVTAPLTLLYKLVRSRIKAANAEIKHRYPLLLKHTMQSVEGLAEIRSFKKESFFQRRFSHTFQKVTEIFSRDHTIQTNTGRVSELIAGVCICALLFYTILFAETPSETVLLLSIYAAVSFRIIPSINRVFSAFVQLKAHEHILDELQEAATERKTEDAGKIESIVFYNSIELRDITFQHGRHTVFNNTSLTIRKNEKVLVFGKSGSGKTTFLLLLMGFLKPGSGEILVDGKKIKPGQLPSMQKLFGYVPQNPYMLDASILENIAFGVREEDIDINKVKAIAEELDLTAWINSLPRNFYTTIGENGNKISGGQRQRIAIARALYHDAEVLLLDEVTSQLDRNTEAEVMKVFNNPLFAAKTIILITHRPSIWKSFDVMYELKHEKLQQAVFTEVR